MLIAPGGARRLARSARTRRRAPGCGPMGFEAGARRGAVPAGRRTGRSPRALVGWGAPERARATASAWPRAAAKLPAGTLRAGAGGRRARPGARGARLADGRLPLRPLPRRQAARASRSSAPTGVDAGADRADRRRRRRLAQDLINTPARDMGPEALEAAFVALAARHGAEVAGHARRGGAQGREPADDRGGRRRRGRAAAAARPRLGARGRAEGDAGRQGRLLRHRRARHQAGRARWG